jgi:hypothetical protein
MSCTQESFSFEYSHWLGAWTTFHHGLMDIVESGYLLPNRLLRTPRVTRKNSLVTPGNVAGFSLHAEVAAMLMNATSWSGCAATSTARRSWKSGCHSPPAGNTLRTEDPVSQWHHPRDLRAFGFHRPADGAVAQVASQSRPVTWRVCPEQQIAGFGEARQAWEGQHGRGVRWALRPDSRRTSCGHDLGTRTKAGFQGRY